jgi:hypothetical protein
MRFFSPELYVRYNSSDDETANAADAEWEESLEAYRAHLHGLHKHMPSPVRKLSELCLHDAELLTPVPEIEQYVPISAQPGSPSTLAILAVRQGDRVVSLTYVLWDAVRFHASSPNWPFSLQGVHWLYDEIDVAPFAQGLYVHRVLLSDGRVVEIPMVSVVVHGVDVSVPKTNGAPRRARPGASKRNKIMPSPRRRKRAVRSRRSRG